MLRTIQRTVEPAGVPVARVPAAPRGPVCVIRLRLAAALVASVAMPIVALAAASSVRLDKSARISDRASIRSAVQHERQPRRAHASGRKGVGQTRFTDPSGEFGVTRNRPTTVLVELTVQVQDAFDEFSLGNPGNRMHLGVDAVAVGRDIAGVIDEPSRQSPRVTAQ